MIGDVGAAHRQRDRAVDPTGPHREGQQEGRQTLFRRLAAERHQLRLRGGQAIPGQIQQAAGEIRTVMGGDVDLRPRIAPHHAIDHRFGRDPVAVADFEAQHVAGDQEIGDVATAVGHQLVDPQHAGQDAVDGVRGIALAEQDAVAQHELVGAGGLERRHHVQADRGTDRVVIPCRHRQHDHALHCAGALVRR